MPCSGSPAVGVYGKMLIEPGTSPHTFDASSERYVIVTKGPAAENIQKHGRLIGGQGISGLVRKLSSRVRQGGYYCYGQFTINPSPGDFDTLLDYLVGDESTDVWTAKDCPNPFGTLIYRDKEAWEYKDCYVAGWVLEGRAPQYRERGEPDILTLTVHVIAKDENKGTSWPSPEPSVPSGGEYYPYTFQDLDDGVYGGVTIGGVTREIYGFRLTYDNHLKVKYANSLTAQAIFSTGRTIKLDVYAPWDAANDNLYDMGYTGSAAQVKMGYLESGLTNPHYTQFDLANLKVPPESPYIKDEEEVAFRINGITYGTASAAEFTVTNVVSVT